MSFFLLNWLSGTYKTSEDRDRNVNTIQLTDEESFNVKWINQSKGHYKKTKNNSNEL